MQHVVEPTTPQRNATLVQTQQMDHLPGIEEGQNQSQETNAQKNSEGNVQAAAQTSTSKRHVFTPELHVTDRRQLKNQSFHQRPMFFGSNPRRPLQIKLT